jgi:hypothetical protein
MLPSNRQMRHVAEVTTTGTPIKVLDAESARTALIVQETGGTNSIRFGDSKVDATYGIFVAAGGTVILEGFACPTGDIYVDSDAGAGVVQVTEIVG